MEYYVISPNVWNDGNFKDLLEAMYKDHMVLMGWRRDDPKGLQFANMKKGDCVIVAQRTKYTWKYYFTGIIKSNETSEYKGAQCKYLETFLDLKNIENDFLSKWSTAGSKQIPAIGRIKKDINKEIINYLFKLIMKTKQMANITEIKELLIENKNLILHGAPGTGKTHLAKQIAKEMGCSDDEIGFVQFHPSYDYTDFVEGLRPAKNNGFERKDGVFKEFCKKAIESSSVGGIDNFDTSIQNMLQKMEDNDGFLDIPLLSKKETFRIALNINEDGFVTQVKKEDDTYEKVPSRCYNFDQCYRVYKNLPGVPKGGFDNYRKAIIEYMKANCELSEYKPANDTSNSNKPFVFIIDEINRGELSKIFGELFFSIDPGYRGEKGRINTQYQNLIEDDVFKDGFFIPDNVYIIGTMNDIDRSVESMDFAMRRRFTFKEITAKDTQKTILSELDDLTRDEAVNRMDSLNNAIDEIDGLSSAYHIGGAYFLKLKDLQNNFENLWEYHLSGLLREYLRGMEDAVKLLEDLHDAYNLKNQE